MFLFDVLFDVLFDEDSANLSYMTFGTNVMLIRPECEEGLYL